MEWGTGKTSIVHALNLTAEREADAGASFFCSRSAFQEVRDASLVTPTIATILFVLRCTMAQVIEKKTEVSSLHTLPQIRLLLAEPIQRALGSRLSRQNRY